MRALYDWFLRPAAEAAGYVAAAFDPRLRRTMSSRRASFKNISCLYRPSRNGPRLWLHAPSLGELYSLGEVIRSLRELTGSVPVLLVTVTSTSALEAAKAIAGDQGTSGLLPPDSSKRMGRLFSWFSPDLVLISQYDTWPGMFFEAERRRVPLVLVGGLLRKDSSKLKFPASLLYRRLYGYMSFVAAVSEGDARRLVSLGVAREKIAVLGDPRVDRAFRIAGRAFAYRGAFNNLRTWMVAGSTWPEDEAVLLPALATCINRGVDAAMVVAPHETTESRVCNIEARARHLGLKTTRLSQHQRREREIGADVVILDVHGELSTAYGLSKVAHVGGGYGKGVHNVLEPAAHGTAVCFGPRYANAYEAVKLVESGAAFVVRNERDMLELLLDACESPGALRQAGQAAEAYVRDNLGAAERTARELIERFPNVLLQRTDSDAMA